jgi:hypothetical protein
VVVRRITPNYLFKQGASEHYFDIHPRTLVAEYDLGFRGQIFDVGSNVENITFVDDHLSPRIYGGDLKF